MTIAHDFDFDAEPRKPTYSDDILRMFALNRNLSADHHRLFRAVEFYDRKFGVPASVEELSVIMGESMERVLEIAKEIEEMSAAMNAAINGSPAASDASV